ncbi:hypothetical protein E4P35_08000 [Thiopseudomonas sp. 4R-3cl]|nr:hypothetical protein E4P35_08000 [Thiopseudomonas sp. 4R-3cl]
MPASARETIFEREKSAGISRRLVSSSRAWFPSGAVLEVALAAAAAPPAPWHIMGVVPVTWPRIWFAAFSHLLYSSGWREFCTAWAADPGAMPSQPGMSSRPGGMPLFGPVGPPKNARAAYSGFISSGTLPQPATVRCWKTLTESLLVPVFWCGKFMDSGRVGFAMFWSMVSWSPVISATWITLPEGSEWTLSPEQVENAALIIGVARELNISDKGIQVALMTGLQETMLQNMANPTLPESMNFPHQKTGTNKDSVNVFQQRTVAGWGSVPELMNPEYAARAFFGGPTGPNKGMPPGLLDIPGWEGMAPGSAAQAVQNSRHPDEYNKWENAANQILGQVTGTTPMMCQGAGGAAAAASATSSTAPEGNHALDEDTKRLEIPADFSRSKIVSRAEAGIGGTYTYGAAEFRSWDATGLVSRVYQDNGIDMPRQAPWTVGKRTETPQPGDIVAQKWDPTRGRWEHVGIYVGDGMMISAINESAGTRKHPVTQTGTDTVYFDVIQEKK